MARNGTVTTNSYDTRYLQFDWSVRRQNTADNSTTIGYTLKGAGNDSMWYMSGNFYINIDGNRIYHSETRIRLENGTVVTSGEYTLRHNSDGTKSFRVEIGAGIYNYAVNCTGAGNFTLDRIPRASGFGSILGTTIGGNMTVNIIKQSNFMHKVYYYEGARWFCAADNVGSQAVFQLPLTLCNNYPNDMNGILRLKLETYSGSSKISEATTEVRVQVPTSVVPNVTSSVSEGVSGISSQFGCYVRYKSRLKVNLTTSGAYGSTIKSCKTVIEGSEYNGTSFTSYPINGVGDISIKSTVTDSRGQSKTYSRSISVVDYFPPQITRFEAERCDEKGNLTDDGLYAKFVFSYNVAPINNRNSLTAKIEKYENGSWSSIKNFSGYFKENETIINGKFDIKNQVQVRLNVADYFTNALQSSLIQTEFSLISFGEDGHSVTLGGTINKYGHFLSYLPSFIGTIFMNKSEKLGLYDGALEREKGWIGHGGSDNLQIINTVGGTIGGNMAWTTSSDKRLKKNIQNIEGVYLQIWHELIPRVFEFNELNYGNGVKHYGLIAQEVIEIFKKYNLDSHKYGFTSSFEIDGIEYYSITYDSYHMITAQVLRKTIDDVEQLKNEINEIKKRLL